MHNPATGSQMANDFDALFFSPKPRNPVTLVCPHNILLFHQTTIVTLTPLITPMTKNIMPNVAALVAILTAVYAVVTIMMMIAAVSVPLVLTMIPYWAS